MAQVSVVVNGRLFQLECEEGGQEQLKNLSAYLNQKIDELKKNYPQEKDEQLLVIASLMITDEFFDTREALANVLSKLNMASEESVRTDA